VHNAARHANFLFALWQPEAEFLTAQLCLRTHRAIEFFPERTRQKHTHAAVIQSAISGAQKARKQLRRLSQSRGKSRDVTGESRLFLYIFRGWLLYRSAIDDVTAP